MTLIRNLAPATSVKGTDLLIIEQPDGTKQISVRSAASIMFPLAAIPGLSDATNVANGAALVGFGAGLDYPNFTVGGAINDLGDLVVEAQDDATAATTTANSAAATATTALNTANTNTTAVATLTQSTVRYANNVAAMKGTPHLPGTVVRTTGYYNATTGVTPSGGAAYYVIGRSAYDLLRGNVLGTTALGNGGDGTTEWIDITLSNGNVAVYIHDGVLRATQAGLRGDGTTDDSNACTAAVNWCVRATQVNPSGILTPLNGRTNNFLFDPGFYRLQNVYINGTMCIRGSETGSYAGAVLEKVSATGYLFRLGKDWSDGGSNATTFQGLRFRAIDIGVVGNNSSMIDGDPTAASLSSIYFYRCWFSWSENWMVTVMGGDWKFEGCTFDTATISGVRLGTASVAAVETKFISCTFFGIQSRYIEAVNATATLVSGCQAYGIGGQNGTFYWGQNNIHAVPSINITGNTIETIPRVALVNHQLFTFASNICNNVGASSQPVIALGGGSTLATIAITDNTMLVASTAVAIDATGTALNTSTITDNRLISSSNANPAMNLPGSNSGSDFGRNIIAGFATRATINRSQQNKVSRKLQSPSMTPGAITTGTQSTQIVAVVGLAPDVPVSWVLPSGARFADGLIVDAVCTVADQVYIRYLNTTAGTITVSAHTLFLTQPIVDEY